jgi:alanine racemase
MPSCWVEVNLDAIRHNYCAIKGVVGDETSIIAVVKANAYGHGAVEVSRALSEEGVSHLAVTRLDEALPLRAAGLLTPILLLTPALPDETEEVVAQNLTACLSSYEDAERLSQAATRCNITARAHLKINTGMGALVWSRTKPLKSRHASRNCRISASMRRSRTSPLPPNPTLQKRICSSRAFSPWHSASPTPPDQAHSVSLRQFSRDSALSFDAPVVHPPRHNSVWPYPSTQAKESAGQQRLELRDGFAVKARVLAIRHSTGANVGYGGEWKAAKPTRIATIAIGWADGLTMEPNPRTPQPKAELQKALRALLKRTASTRSVTIRGTRAHYRPHRDAAMLD